jgi:hypothetical protein
MASPSIIPFNTSHHTKNNTNVVRLPIPSPIGQDELGHILEMRRQREALDEQIKESETAVRAALEAGAVVEDGVFRAYLKPGERRSVAWKAIVERELGEGYANRVLAATKPDKFTTLVVSA